MHIQTSQSRTARGVSIAVMLALTVSVIATRNISAQSSPVRTIQQGTAMTEQSKFYCDMKALSSAERAQHAKLTAKLIAVRTDIVDYPKGYEFQYSPSTMSLAELADWAVVESKCCPFFNFHIDMENEGRLLCLRLTGQEGIKAFIRSEFQVPSN